MIGPTISPHDSSLVVEHCDMTGAYITADAGRSWRMFNLRTVVRCFTFDPASPDVIYAGNMAVWRSADRGRTWTMVWPDPADRSKVYITTFGGSVWHGPATGDPHAPEDLTGPTGWRR